MPRQYRFGTQCRGIMQWWYELAGYTNHRSVSVLALDLWTSRDVLLNCWFNLGVWRIQPTTSDVFIATLISPPTAAFSRRVSRDFQCRTSNRTNVLPASALRDYGVSTGCSYWRCNHASHVYRPSRYFDVKHRCVIWRVATGYGRREMVPEPIRSAWDRWYKFQKCG